ncbi:MAG: hypothetical protein KIT17_17385 [Rubrivivax sp.]|nr:hypothetical protein [Rubrivivax sp.]
MEKQLHLLETIATRGSDGNAYTVHGYEHMARVDAVPDMQGLWEPTGQVEYRLADGRHVEPSGEGFLAAGGLRLERLPRA